MGKMFDNFRAFWNELGDKFSDPGKLAQLSVADLEKAIVKAKDAAAIVVGRPVALNSKLKELEKSDQELTVKIKALIKTGEAGQTAAKKYVERQVSVRRELSETRADFDDAKLAADEWKAKIRALENELFRRRNEANKLQADYETAKAEQKLGKQMQNLDSLTGSDKFSALKERVNKEKAKAAGYSAMSGLDDRLAEDKLLADAETDALMAEYLQDETSKESQDLFDSYMQGE